MKKIRQSKFSKFIDWLFGMAYIVPEWKMYSYLRERNMYKDHAEMWRKNSDSNLKLMNEIYEHSQKNFKGWEDALNLCNKISKNCDDFQDTCKKYQELVDRYSKDTLSLEKTIDSLVGELIIRGVTEDEIDSMFHGHDGDVSYKSVMAHLNANR